MESMLAELPAERRKNVEARGRTLVEREMKLRALRVALGQTQTAMAEKLGVKQENVSRVEQRADMLISTLNGYLRALGGRLTLVAEFSGQEPVRLKGFGFDEVVEDDVAPSRKRRSKAPI